MFFSSDSGLRLEEHIKLHHLQKLMHIFKSHVPQEKTQDDKKSRKGKKSFLFYRNRIKIPRVTKTSFVRGKSLYKIIKTDKIYLV